MQKRIPPKAGGVLQIFSTVTNKWIDCQIVDVRPFVGISFIYDNLDGNKTIRNISVNKLMSDKKFYRILR